MSARIARAPAKQRPSGYWLYFKHRASSGGQYVRGAWQGEIIAGLYLHEAHVRGWIRPRWYSQTVVLANGDERLDSGSSLSVSGAFSARELGKHASEQELRAEIAAAAAKVGVRLSGLRFAHLLGGLAVQITVVVDDPRAFVADDGAIIGALRSPVYPPDARPRAEGALIEVRDRQGRWVASSGSSARLGSGVGSTNPRFREK